MSEEKPVVVSTPEQITQDLLREQLKCLQSLKSNIQFMTVVLALVIIGYVINFVYMVFSAV